MKAVHKYLYNENKHFSALFCGWGRGRRADEVFQFFGLDFRLFCFVLRCLCVVCWFRGFFVFGFWLLRGVGGGCACGGGVQGVEEVVVVVLVCCCGRRGGRGTLDGFRHGMFRLAVACVCVCVLAAVVSELWTCALFFVACWRRVFKVHV